MSRALFRTAAGLLIYTYLVFPLLVLVRGRWRPKPVAMADLEPTVTIVIAARNERVAIGSKLDNLLGLEYRADRTEVIVASDGSDDGTGGIVAGYAPRGVRLLALPRCGKAAALNAAVAEATGDIVVFTDANSMFVPEALSHLARPFADPAVGGVAGNQVYLPDRRTEGTAVGERTYWDFDRWLKTAESRAGNVVSATGAIYAIRRKLFTPITAGVTDDLFVSLSVIRAGHRFVFAPEAIAYEPVAASRSEEFGRKVRVMTRGLRGVYEMRCLLDPRRYGFYAIELLSHKVLRRTMAVPLLVLATVTPLLRRSGPLYRTAATVEAIFLGLALGGLALARHPLGRSKLLALPAYFCLVNAASLVAIVNLLRGRRLDRWEPRRPAGPGTGSATDVSAGNPDPGTVM